MEVMQKKTGTRTEIRNDRREVQVRVRNAQDENYELVMLDEFPVLFTNGRLDRKSIPEGLFCYDIRHDDECQGIACEVKPFVLVNHWGTILSKSEIPLENGSYYPEDDLNYLGIPMGLKEFMDMDTGQMEAAVGMKLDM